MNSFAFVNQTVELNENSEFKPTFVVLLKTQARRKNDDKFTGKKKVRHMLKNPKKHHSLC